MNRDEIVEYLQSLYKNASSDAERREIEREWDKLMKSYAASASPPPRYIPMDYRVRFDMAYDAFRNSSLAAAWAASDVEPPKPKPLPEEHMVSAIIGYRAWNVPLFVDELRSTARASKWLPYQRFEASCELPQCSGVSCSCGIYAFKAMDSVQKSYTQADQKRRYVWGECWLWGRILECTLGYRAQFAYPKSFVNSGAISKRMAEVFGVELAGS